MSTAAALAVKSTILIIPLLFGHCFPLCFLLFTDTHFLISKLYVTEIPFKEGQRREKKRSKTCQSDYSTNHRCLKDCRLHNLRQMEAILQTKWECLTSYSLSWSYCLGFTQEKENWIQAPDIPTSDKQYSYFTLRQFTYWHGKKEDMPLHIEQQGGKKSYSNIYLHSILVVAFCCNHILSEQRET